MQRKTHLLLLFFAPMVLAFPAGGRAQNAPAPMPLADLTSPGIESRFVPSFDSTEQVSAARSTDAAAPGVNVTIAPGKAGYPGASLKPEGGKDAVWNLADHGHVEAVIVNTGTQRFSVSMRVDNFGDWRTNPFNCETVALEPGTSGTVSVIFGYGNGKKPAFKLDPAKVSAVLFYVGKSGETRTFRIESLKAAGFAGEKPPVDPASLRIKPKDGFLLGGGVEVDAAKQVEAKNNAQAALEGKALKAVFTGKGQSVVFRPSVGRWDLREALEVRVKVKNAGSAPASPRIQVLSNSGPAAEAGLAKPLAPGERGEIVASFVPLRPWEGIKDSAKTSWIGQPGTGTEFISDAVSGVKILSGADGSAQTLLVEEIAAKAPAPDALPDWLGKRPPVEGDWVKTFDEEFDGNAIDEKKWNIYSGNPWDKRSHFSRENVRVGGGLCKLHYEKKTGFVNDDPSKGQTDYATGFLSTSGKWVQRYGYFESRMKLTRAPGLWPAFWLMPDRGVEAGPSWKRSDTANGGMEFDIMEFLARWGQYRYNIAMHWDGYGKSHQQTGTTKVYFAPDKDGFITAGLLWTPGLAVYYANGREVARWETPRISVIQSHIIFTNVTGGWDNDPLDDAKLPDDFVIDYVRCWQRKDLASAVDGFQSPTPASAE